jgi:hypothetical protein
MSGTKSDNFLTGVDYIQSKNMYSNETHPEAFEYIG